MLRDITLGQYYRADSVIHRLDPRVKIVATFVFIISLFLVKNFIGYLVAGLFLCLCIKLSTVPPKFIFRGMKAIFFLLLIKKSSQKNFPPPCLLQNLSSSSLNFFSIAASALSFDTLIVISINGCLLMYDDPLLIDLAIIALG